MSLRTSIRSVSQYEAGNLHESREHLKCSYIHFWLSDIQVFSYCSMFSASMMLCLPFCLCFSPLFKVFVAFYNDFSRIIIILILIHSNKLLLFGLLTSAVYYHLNVLPKRQVFLIKYLCIMYALPVCWLAVLKGRARAQTHTHTRCTNTGKQTLLKVCTHTHTHARAYKQVIYTQTHSER